MGNILFMLGELIFYINTIYPSAYVHPKLQMEEEIVAENMLSQKEIRIQHSSLFEVTNFTEKGEATVAQASSHSGQAKRNSSKNAVSNETQKCH